MLPRVMVVEDDDIIREIYALKFEIEGYDIAVAENGERGLKLADEFRPDIILLDMMMPVMGGLDFMRQYGRGTAEIIVFSNISAPAQMQEVMALGASEYWVKSDFTPEQVVEAISKRWQERRGDSR